MGDSSRPRPAHIQVLAVAWNFGWPIATGVMCGYWLDLHLGSSPAMSLVFGVGAMAASVWRLIELSRRESEEIHEAEREERRRSRGGRE
jgi:hypothetical protein